MASTDGDAPKGKAKTFSTAVNKVMSLDVNLSIAGWLRKRGKNSRPELSRQQRQELVECFRLIDTDGSGAIDADELHEAFKVLGIQVSRKDIEMMLNNADVDGTGEIEYPEFVQIMMSQLAQFNEPDPTDIWAERPQEEKVKDRMGNLRTPPPKRPTGQQLARIKEQNRQRKRREKEEAEEKAKKEQNELERLAAQKREITRRLSKARSMQAGSTPGTFAKDAAMASVPEDEDEEGDGIDEDMKRRVQDAPLPFQMMATAYRRRRFLEGVMYNQDDMRRKVVAKEEEAQEIEAQGRSTDRRMSLGALMASDADGNDEDLENEKMLRKRMRRRASMAFSDGYMGEYDDGFTPPPELRPKGVGTKVHFEVPGIHSLKSLISQAKMSKGKGMWHKGLDSMRSVAHEQQMMEQLRVQQRLQNAKLMVRRRFKEDSYLVDEGQWLMPEEIEEEMRRSQAGFLAGPVAKGGTSKAGGLLAALGVKTPAKPGDSSGASGGGASASDGTISEEPSFELSAVPHPPAHLAPGYRGGGEGGGGGTPPVVSSLDLSGLSDPSRKDLMRSVPPEHRYKLYDPFEYGEQPHFHYSPMNSAITSASSVDGASGGKELWERRRRPGMTSQQLRLEAQGSVRALGDQLSSRGSSRGDAGAPHNYYDAGTRAPGVSTSLPAIAPSRMSPVPPHGSRASGAAGVRGAGGRRISEARGPGVNGSLSFAGPAPMSAGGRRRPTPPSKRR